MKGINGIRIIIVCLLFHAFHSSCAQTIKNTRTVYDFSFIEQRVRGWIDSGYYSGASLLVAKDNRVIYKNYFGNYKPETIVFIASAGKWLVY